MKAYPIVYLLMLSGLSLHALISLFQSAPLLAGMGLLLSCLAPLGFMIVDRYQQPSRREGHPVMISMLCGFGAVMTMVAVERFGDHYQAFVMGSAIALAGWLIYVRWFWRITKVPGR